MGSEAIKIIILSKRVSPGRYPGLAWVFDLYRQYSGWSGAHTPTDVIDCKLVRGYLGLTMRLHSEKAAGFIQGSSGFTLLSKKDHIDTASGRARIGWRSASSTFLLGELIDSGQIAVSTKTMGATRSLRKSSRAVISVV